MIKSEEALNVSAVGVEPAVFYTVRNLIQPQVFIEHLLCTDRKPSELVSAFKDSQGNVRGREP